MEDVCAVLAVNGRIPRRAVVLPDGALGDRRAWPAVAESDLLSRLCEIARGARGVPVYPRRTADLLERALGDNSPGAWEAVRDDLETGDLDMDVAVTVLRQPCNAAALVACLAGAREQDHLVHVACLLSRVLDRVPAEAREEMGRALACQVRAVMDVLARHGGLMTRDVRDAVLDGFGKMLGKAALPGSRVAELLLHALDERRDELLRLFLHVPPAYLDHRPQILPLLLDRAKSAPAASRYPLLAMLARIEGSFPGVLRGHEHALADIVCSSLAPDQLDCRECLAAAALVESVGDGLSRALAAALRVCSAALVRRAAGP